MGENSSAWETASKVKRKKSRKRVVLTVVSVLALVVALLVVFAPSLASPMVRSMVASKGSPAIPGSMDARSVGLSWFGPQRVRGLTIVDPDGAKVADVDVRVEAGLISLAFGGRDLGVVTVSGFLDIEKNEAGELNLIRAVSKGSGGGGGSGGSSGGGASGSGGGGGIPPSLRATVELDGISVSYADPQLAARGIETLALNSILGSVRIHPGEKVEAKLNMDVGGKASTGGAFQSGSVSGSATIDGLIGADGSINADAATIVASFKTNDLDTGLADRLVDAPVSFERAFGSKVKASIEASGAIAKPDARFSVESKYVNAAGAIKFEGDDLVTTEPMTATIAREAFDAIDKAWLAQATGEALNIREMPSVSVRIDSVRVPTGEASLALASGSVSVELGAMDALVSIGEGEEATKRRITTSPGTLTLGTEALGESLSLDGNLAFTVNGREGGTLGVDVVATGIVDESGRLRTDELPVLSGSFGLEGVDTGVIQPFVAAAGVNMGKEIGPTLSVGVNLEPQAGGAITLVRGEIASENANGEINLILEGTGLTADDPGGHLRLASVGPLLTRMFREQGLRVREGARVEVTLSKLGVDLSGAMSGRGLSASNVDVSAEVFLGPTSGVILVDGSARSFDIEQVGAFIEFGGSKGVMQARVTTGGRFDGSPAGQVSAEVRLVDMFGDDGQIGMPSSIAGRAEFIGISTRIAEPFIRDASMRPGVFIGPTLDVLLEARSRSDGKTKLIATITSEKLTGDGAFLISQRALEVDPEEGYTLSHTGLASAIAGAVDLGPAMKMRDSGAVAEVHLSRLVIPIDEGTRSLRIGETDLAARMAIRNVYLDPADDAAEKLELRQMVINPRLKPESDPSVRIATVLYSGKSKVQGGGTMTLPGLVAALDGTGSWDLGSLGPSGTLTFDDIPSGLLARAIAMAGLEGLDADSVARDIAGDALSAKLNLAPDGDAVRMTLNAEGTRLTVSGDAVFGTAFEQATLDAQVKLSRPSGEQVLRSVLPDMADTISIVGTTALRVNATVSPAGTLDARVLVPTLVLRGLDEQDLRLRVDANAGKADADGDLTLRMETTIENAARAIIGQLTANLQRGGDEALTGTIFAEGLRPAWADRLLGTEDLYTGLLGNEIGFSGDVATSGQATTINAKFQAPTLSQVSVLALRLADGAVILDKPFRAQWTGDKDWINRRLARTLGQEAPTLNTPLGVDLRLRSLSLPPADGAVLAAFALNAVGRIDTLDLTMPGGERRVYQQVQIVARSTEDATGVQVVAKGDVRLGDSDPVRAIDLTADIRNVADGKNLTTDKAYADVQGRIDHVPTSLIDALAGTNGWLTRMLGEEVSVEKLVVERAPLEGGTVSMDLASPASRAHLSGSFQDAKQDGQLVDGYFVLDEGGFIELSKFDESFTKSIYDVVPIFGELKRDPEADRASRIDIRSGRFPLNGAVEDVRFDLSADPGSVQYGLSGPIQSVLKMTGQNAMGQMGARIQPFDVRMAKGVINYDKLAVPLGEFTFTSEGEINLLKQVKNIFVFMPAGAFAAEAFGAQGALGSILDTAAAIPMSNAGPLSATGWKADFSKAFKADKVLENTIKKGIGDLLKPKDGGAKPDGGG
jgi:hypothetical protein